jgi:hypothetical protein
MAADLATHRHCRDDGHYLMPLKGPPTPRCCPALCPARETRRGGRDGSISVSCGTHYRSRASLGSWSRVSGWLRSFMSTR